MVTMNIISGEVDFLIGDVSLTDMPLFKQSEEKGGFRVPMLETHYAKTIFVLNPTFEDEVFQELVNNKDFRKAINMAIDREEIINSVYYGFASTPNTIPADYDVEQANQILDDLGMTGRDDKGFRLGPDGEKFDILLEVAEMRPDFIPTAEIIVEQLREDLELNISLKQI
ncbi:MAG: hypothetical protein K9K76_12090, partial [Halanaerobiales bacterium]|nr:hypothetical protein [Halanaerobiales bacterium]